MAAHPSDPYALVLVGTVAVWFGLPLMASQKKFSDELWKIRQNPKYRFKGDFDFPYRKKSDDMTLTQEELKVVKLYENYRNRKARWLGAFISMIAIFFIVRIAYDNFFASQN